MADTVKADQSASDTIPPAVDLDDLSRDELRAMQASIDAALAAIDMERREEARRAVEATANELGFRLQDLVRAKRSRRVGSGTVPPKYRHPENPSVTWSGLGRRPHWFREALQRGESPETLMIALTP